MKLRVLQCLLLFTLVNFFVVKSVYAVALQVNVYPSEIDQLGKYVVDAQNTDGTAFSGNLQVRYWLCPPNTSSHSSPGCQDMAPVTFPIPANGKTVLDLAYYASLGSPISVGKYFQQWRPENSGYDWSPEVQVSVTPLDMKRYFNLNPGNYYRYKASNFKMNQFVQDATRLDLTPINLCGENLISMDFSKTSPFAYWDTNYGGDSRGTDFLSWRGNFNSEGNLQFKTWAHFTPSPLPNNLGLKPQFNYQDLQRNIYQRGFTFDGQDSPNAQYFYGPQFLDLNLISHTRPHVNGEVRFSATNKNPNEGESDYYQRFCVNASNDALNSGFLTMPIAEFYVQNIQTPGYIGPAVSLNIKEVYIKGTEGANNCIDYNSFLSNNCPKVLREDWFLAKDIGLVRMDQKYFGSIYGVSSTNCVDDPDCNNASVMSSPFLKEEATSYQVAQPAEHYLKQIDLGNGWKRLIIHLNRNDFSSLNYLQNLNELQIVVDDDANWDNGYGLRVMLNTKAWNIYPNSNQVNGNYLVNEPTHGGNYNGWQSAGMTSTYHHDLLGMNIKVAGFYFDGNDLEAAIDIENGASLANKNIYLYLEGSDGQHGVIPKFALGSDSYNSYGTNYTFAKIGQFTPSVNSPTPIPSFSPTPSPTSMTSPTPTTLPISTPSPTTTPLPGDLDGNHQVNHADYDLFSPYFGQSGNAGWVKADINNDGRVDILDFNILVGNFGRGQ